MHKSSHGVLSVPVPPCTFTPFTSVKSTAHYEIKQAVPLNPISCIQTQPFNPSTWYSVDFQMILRLCRENHCCEIGLCLTRKCHLPVKSLFCLPPPVEDSVTQLKSLSNSCSPHCECVIWSWSPGQGDAPDLHLRSGPREGFGSLETWGNN